MILYAAKKSVEMFGSAAKGNKERYRNDPDYRNQRRLLLAGAAIGSSLGLVAGANNTSVSESEVTSEVAVGKAVVQYINYDFSEQRIIAFGTRVDGTVVRKEEPRQIDLPFGVEVPLPAFENKITLNNSVTENSLCFPGGTKRIKETTYPDGKRHYEVRIDPADISVCSKKDPNVIPETLPESNWVVDLNHADSAVMAAMGIETERARKDQKLEDEMRHIGELASQALVDKNCGSQVFLEAKDDFEEKIIEDTVRSDNETAEVIFDVKDGQELAISTASDTDDFLSKKRAEGWEIETGEIEDCVIPEAVLEGENERAQ